MSDVKQLAGNHVGWFLKIIRPLMITEFEHGYKHGLEKGIKIGREQRD